MCADCGLCGHCLGVLRKDKHVVHFVIWDDTGNVLHCGSPRSARLWGEVRRASRVLLRWSQPLGTSL